MENGPAVRALADATSALERATLDYVLVGGLASSVRGRPRSTDDIDLLVRPDDARAVLGALAGAGFATDELDATWLFKATRDGVLIDVIFKISGDIYLDEELLARATREQMHGHEVTVVSAEDLVVIKAIAHNEAAFRHWHDALGILAVTPDLDWDYLVRRARFGARRVLSLLVYAQSNDLVVPEQPIRDLFAAVYAAG
jgi:predicted nucleotidyltransferase